uniref:Protocadherin gamma-B5-like n=2 Tax=Cynoglossus semilaevis TaxID=244447 RepID=A0A3P8VDZ3_CYNSE
MFYVTFGFQLCTFGVFFGTMRNKGLLTPGRIFCFVFFVLTSHVVHGDLSYSVPEEMKRGSYIGNLAKDLGIELRAMSLRNARVDFEESQKQYCDINVSTGDLITSERIDRESLCGKKP